MSIKTVVGNYILKVDLADLLLDYSLTGSNRNADLITVDYNRFRFTLSYMMAFINSEVYFLKDNKIKIKAVRILTPGCEGLRASPGKVAAKLVFQGCRSDGTSLSVKPIELMIDRFNEWQKIDIWYDPNSGGFTASEDYYFKPAYASCQFNIDDYNIQTAYIGEKVKAFFEIEIDTPGVVSFADGSII